MRDSNRFDRERTSFVGCSWCDRQKLHVTACHPVFLEPLSRQFQRMRWPPNRYIRTDTRQKVGQTPDMILVPMRQHDPPHSTNAREQMVKPRVIDVDTQIG